MGLRDLATGLKSSIRSIVRSAGYDVVRYVDQPQRPFDLLRLVVARRVAERGPLRFVQIGANDGIMDDPMRELILTFGLTGVLVEPLPDHFARLCANYSSVSGLSFEKSAIGESQGDAIIYRVRADADVPAWLHGVASFNRHHIDRFNLGNKSHSMIEPVKVPVTTISSLIKKHNIEDFDLLQIDTEGMDCQIVRWALEADLRPEIIHYENCHVTPEARAECKMSLAKAGYQFIDAGTNTLALREG